MTTLPLAPDDAEFFSRHDWIKDNVRPRITGERLVFRTLAKTLLDAGFSLRIHDGEDWTGPLTTNLDRVTADIMATDDDKLYVYLGDGENKPRQIGWAWFIYGNMANEVINDYSTTLEPYMGDTNKVMDQLLEMRL